MINLGEDALTITQISDVLHLSDTIIDNLDAEAMLQLMSGSGGDIDQLFYNITSEVKEITTNKTPGGIKGSTFGYLDKLAANVEETLRVENFSYFIVTVLPDFEMNWHHVEWCNMVQTYKYLCVIAARGHGKSYFFSMAYPLWKMYRYQASTPLKKARKSLGLSKNGILFTYETGLGEELLLIIKDQIEGNEILHQKLFPNTRDNWSKRSIRCKNGARLQIKSYGSAARGRHPGYIIVDDFLIENVLYSENVRKKVTGYFHSVIMNMIVNQGQVLVCGTPFHSADLYGDLKSPEKRRAWKVFEYPSIFPDGSLLWDSKFSLNSLLEKKESQGSIIFSREILCKPVSSESTIFPYELIARAFRPDRVLIKNIYSSPIKFRKVVMGCDFAISASVGADYSVYVTIGVDDTDKMHILNITRTKGKRYSEQLVVIKQLYNQFRHDVIFMESNQMQVIFAQGAQDSNLPVVAHQTGTRRSGTNKYDFQNGLPGLAILFENQKIIIPAGDVYSKDLAETMAAELSSIAYTDQGLKSVSGHDDMPMALWIATCAAKYKDDFSYGFI